MKRELPKKDLKTVERIVFILQRTIRDLLQVVDEMEVELKEDSAFKVTIKSKQ